MLACGPDGELSRAAKLDKIPVWEVPMRGEWDAMAAWRLGNLANEVDVVHAQTVNAHTLALLAVRIGTWRPVVVNRRGDIRSIGGAFARWKNRAADCFVANSESVAKFLKTTGISSRKIRIVHSGVDLMSIEGAPRKDIRAELGLPESTPIIGNVTHLDEHKGHRYLIEAMPEILRYLPAVHAVIGGKGEKENELKNMSQRLGVEQRVHFIGYRRDAHSIIKSFDVYVVPSHIEGFGTCLLDAVAAGAPVAATSVGGVAEIINDGVEGALFAPGDPRALATSVAGLLKNPARAKKMAEAASARLRKQFTDEIMVKGMLGVYKEVVA